MVTIKHCSSSYIKATIISPGTAANWSTRQLLVHSAPHVHVLRER